MNKIINIYQNPKQILDGVYNVHIDKLDSIPNYSVSQTISKAINFIDLSIVPKAVFTICQKLNVGGYCVIEILNFNSVATAYTKGSISDEAIFDLLKDRINIVSFPSLKTIIDQDSNLIIHSIDISKHTTSIKIERIKL
jgi:hypothetical protein